MYSKNGGVIKIFFVLTVVGLVIYLLLSFDAYRISRQNFFPTTIHTVGTSDNKPFQFGPERLKYILFWTMNEKDSLFGEGQTPFITNKCPISSCYISERKNAIENDYRMFHAIVFNISEVLRPQLPEKRWPHQKYVFHSMLPASSYPICNMNFDNFFNWTWTYKLNSDIVSPFIDVREMAGNKVAPSEDVEWAINVDADNIYDITMMKANALAWFIDDCNVTNPDRLLYAKQLKRKLIENNLDFDIYGCGAKECTTLCDSVLERYYFYFAYESHSSEDYVTAEVVKAYNSNSVPIVFAEVDYAKFLPKKSYINAWGLSPARLAKIISFSINNEVIYKGFFRWKMLYTIQKATLTDGLCQLCTDLNDERKYPSYSNYEFFRKWWYNAPFDEKCPDATESLNQTVAENTLAPWVISNLVGFDYALLLLMQTLK